MNNDLGAWLIFFVHWSMVPLSIIWVFDGTRRVISKRAAKSSIALGVVGAGFLLGNAAVCAWSTQSLSDMLDKTFESAKVQVLPPNVLAQLTAAERAEKTHFLAHMNFLSTGILTRHLTVAGETVVFAPTQAEFRERENQRESLAEIRARIELIRTKMYAFSIAVLVAVLAGAMTARTRGLENDG